jgi:hypothetical protein
MPRDMALWHGPHRRRSLALLTAAYRDPSAVCWLCHRTLADGPRYRNGRASTWHADHVMPGDPASPLRLAHSLCNERRGGAHGNARRRAKRFDLQSPNA